MAGKSRTLAMSGDGGGIIPARFAIFAFDRRGEFGYIPACED